MYAAVHVAFTRWLLEVFAAIGHDILRLLRFEDSESKKGYGGLAILQDSIERILAALPQAK